MNKKDKCVCAYVISVNVGYHNSNINIEYRLKFQIIASLIKHNAF